jgi:microcystin-dependent protein
MSQPFIGEIRIFAGNFAPAGWMFCEGQLLSISENDALFTLIGTTYGGDGQSTFALPDLRGRLPVHQGNGVIQGETGGVEQVTLTEQQIPVHSHPLTASAGPGNLNSPAGNVLGESAAVKIYVAEQPTASLSPSALAATGGSQPHDNFQPYLCLNFIISLFGVFPSQT